MGSVWRLCVFQCKTAILWTWLSVIEIEALFEYVSIFQADMSDLLMNERQQPSNAAAAMPLPWEKTFFFQRTSQSWVTAIRLQRGKSDFDEHVHLFPPLLKKIQNPKIDCLKLLKTKISLKNLIVSKFHAGEEGVSKY